MHHISRTTDDTLKQIFRTTIEGLRARGHLAEPGRIAQVAWATYELARGFDLPSVKHLEGVSPELYVEDAVANLTTLLSYDLTVFLVEGDEREIETAAVELAKACRSAFGLPQPQPN